MKKIFIVAEIGVNHNGEIELGKRLIDAALKAGADAVKTQLFVAESMTSARARKANYQRKTTDRTESQLDMLKKLELSAEQYCILNDYAISAGIILFAAPFDIKSVNELRKLGSPIIKIPSGEITNLPYLQEIAGAGGKVFMSTGMSDMDEIRSAIDVFKDSRAELTLLHCHTQYPTEYADANLMAMISMRRETGLPVGYSDHTPGIETAIAAAALGAVVIEKHLTLDRTLPGPDHQASLEPEEFARMTHAIRNIEKALGSGEKKASRAEQENIAIARKSIVAARAIRQGEILGADMLTTKRPGDGISPMRWYDIIGATAIRDFAADEQIEL